MSAVGANASPKKIGVVGMGRVGRSIVRQIQKKPDIQLVALCEKTISVPNLKYLLERDSVYPDPSFRMKMEGENQLIFPNGNSVICHKNLDEFLKEIDCRVDVVIDASGSSEVHKALIGKGQWRVIVTEDEPELPVFVFGHTDNEVLKKQKFIAASICDAVAAVPVLHVVESHFGLEHVDIVTIHPWLSYQNVLDNGNSEVESGGKVAGQLTMLRGANNALLPKPSSAAKACARALGLPQEKFTCQSYRVPTESVTSAVLHIQCRESVDLKLLESALKSHDQNTPGSQLFQWNAEELISLDFKSEKASAVVDMRFLRKTGPKSFSLTIWYDNEYGYSSKIVDILSALEGK